MKFRFSLFSLLLIPLAMGLASCSGGAPPETIQPTEEEQPLPSPTDEVVLSGSVSQGGLLYDKWWKVIDADEPTDDNPIWASQDSNTRSGDDTWRCKECHGWDYLGVDGAYGSGSHFTGFSGVFKARGLTDGEILAWLDGSSNPDHDFSAMGESAIADMATFLQEGLVDVSQYIDSETKAAIGGDTQEGEHFYGETCTACHGDDGRTINFGDDEEPEYLGTIATGNPWEFIHKVRAGQPGTQMPSAIDAGWSMQDVVNLLTYSQTLPTEQASVEISLTRGGRLYDKWWKVADFDEPSEDNPVWARQDTNTRSGGDTWRCKECHGWDYMGELGPYGSGSHFTGFSGVFFAQDKSLEEILALLNGEVDPEHNFSAMGEAAATDLATFIQEGQVDMRDYVNYDSAEAIDADPVSGEELYTSTCMACHGDDGRMINFGDDDDPEYLGTIAVGNPWEFIHKVRMGQPGTGMPASFDLDWTQQDVVDILGYSQSLPTE